MQPASIVEIHRRLCATYGCPVPYFHRLDPLSELVSSFLSHRTRNADSGRAFKSLRAAFPTWEQVRDADAASVEEAIKACTWPEQKAPRLIKLLQEITAQKGALDFSFIETMTVAEARAWLLGLPGVGPKTAAATLSFSTLRWRALPVDSHHYRVAQRLKLIGPKVSEAKSHSVLEAMLPAEWDAQAVFDDHEMLMFHGQRCCFFKKPACQRCVLLDVCPTGQMNLNLDLSTLPAIKEITHEPIHR